MYRPTIVAKQFITSLASGGPEALANIESGKLVREVQEYDRECALPTIQTEALLQPATWSDIFNVRRRVKLNLWLPTKASREPILLRGPWREQRRIYNANDYNAFLTTELIVFPSGPRWIDRL